MANPSTAVEGKRSPRWAFFTRMTIPCEDGLVYLVRLRLIQTPWFGIYIHDIYEPDADRDPHDHPWAFISVVLRGAYIERLHRWPNIFGNAPHWDFGVRENTWRRWSVHRMKRNAAHRITDVAPNTRTLIFTGPRRGNWGFFTDDGWVPWQEYEAAKEASS